MYDSEYQKNYRRTHREYFRKYTKKNRKNRKAYLKKYLKQYRKRNKFKNIRIKACKKIKINKPCYLCQTKRRLTRHHPDYSDPLKVIILCRKCHGYVHRLLRVIKEFFPNK